MKKAGATLALMVVLVGLVGCLDQGGPSTYKGPLFRYHFAGRPHLPTGTNAVIYRQVDALPVSAELRKEIARKFAAMALTFWQRDLAPGAPDASAMLRPLFEDLQEAEGMVEVTGPIGRTATVVAAELNDERAKLWDTKLRDLAAAWKLGTPRDVTLEGAKGWEAKRTQAPNTLQLFRAGKWLVVGLGQDSIAAVPGLLKETRANGRPLAALSGHFLEMSADLPRLRPWFPALAKWPLPAATMTVSGRGADIRTEMRFLYSSRIPWRHEPWKIPTQAIGDPLTSFTVAQGVGPLLNALKGNFDVGIDPLPNQVCLWGLQNTQCRMFFGMPVQGDSTNMMKRVAEQLPKYILATVTNVRGDFFFVSNRAELVWADLQFMIPVIHADRSGADNFLVGGSFPLAEKHAPPPDELLAQVRGRTDLLYYDWEITQARLLHGNQFYQLACLACARKLPPTDSVAQRWLTEIAPKLTNTVTEITRVGPQEQALVRRSPIGFTGFELATIGIWLDSPGFPLQFEMPRTYPWASSNSALYRLAHPAPKQPAPGAGSPAPAPRNTNTAPPAGKR